MCINYTFDNFHAHILFKFQDDVYVYAKEYFHPFNPTPLKHKPLVIVGPSGVGKMTLIDAVLKKFGSLFERKKSVTTRAKRQIEKADQNFIFVPVEELKKMQLASQFIECREKGGVWHGTLYKELDRIK